MVDSDFDSGPLRSPASSRTRFLLAPSIEIIDSGVDSDVVPPLEEEQRFCLDSRLILVSQLVQNRFQNRLTIDTEFTTLTSPKWLRLCAKNTRGWIVGAINALDGSKRLHHELSIY